MVIGLHPTEGV